MQPKNGGATCSATTQDCPHVSTRGITSLSLRKMGARAPHALIGLATLMRIAEFAFTINNKSNWIYFLSVL